MYLSMFGLIFEYFSLDVRMSRLSSLGGASYSKVRLSMCCLLLYRICFLHHPIIFSKPELLARCDFTR